MSVTPVLPTYAEIPLPPDAPGWARTWCSERKKLDPSTYDHIAAFLKSLRAGRALPEMFTPEANLVARLDALAGILAWPVYALCAYVENGRTSWGAVMGTLREKPGVFQVGLCGNPHICRQSPDRHLMYGAAVPAAKVTLLGYRHGITPAVIQAIYDGHPYRTVRLMVDDPSFRPKTRAN